VIVAPRGLRLPGRHTGAEIVQVRSGETIVVAGLSIDAVPARHWIAPGAPRAQPLGYVLRGASAGASAVAGRGGAGDVGRPSPRVYFAGDTGRYPAMAELAGGVDLALLPVWTWGPHLGPGHLGPRAAAEVARDIGAAVVVPIHWGTLYPRQLHRLWRKPLMEPGDRFAAYARRLAPDVDVRVLHPGESTTIDRPS
jgi:L-ascorbate metabolism protein UlaG (beta-lactamase superfamily)